jgi:hypothetical protein
MAGFLAAAAPYAIPAGLSIAQGLLGNRQAKRDQQRMEEQAKQDKLIQSFNPQAQPTAPQQASQPGIGQRLLNDPITQQLLSGLAGQIGQPATGGVGGMNDAARDAMRQSYDFANAARRRPMFGG